MRHEGLVGEGGVDVLLGSAWSGVGGVCISIDTVFAFVCRTAFNRGTSYTILLLTGQDSGKRKRDGRVENSFSF